MTSTVKIETAESNGCPDELTSACHFNIKEEPVDFEYYDGTENWAQIKLEENRDIKKEDQDCFNCSLASNPVWDYNPQQQNAPVYDGALSGPPNNSPDVQMEVEVSTSAFESNANELTLDQFCVPVQGGNCPKDQGDGVGRGNAVKLEPADSVDRQPSEKSLQNNTDTCCVIPPITGPMNCLLDVKLEIEVATSELPCHSVSSDDDVVDVTPLSPEQSRTHTLPHLTKEGDYIDESSAADQECFDSLQYLRSAQALRDMEARVYHTSLIHNNAKTAKCHSSETKTVQQPKITRRKSTVARRLIDNGSLVIRKDGGWSSPKNDKIPSSKIKRLYLNMPISKEMMAMYRKSICDVGSVPHSKKKEKRASERQRISEDKGFNGKKRVTSQELRELLLPGSKEAPVPPCFNTPHIKTATVACDYCSKKFWTKVGRNTHHFNDHLVCLLCKQQFTSIIQRNQHLSSYHNSEKKTSKHQDEARWFKCIECSEKHSSIELLDKHMEKRHPLKVSPDLKLSE